MFVNVSRYHIMSFLDNNNLVILIRKHKRRIEYQNICKIDRYIMLSSNVTLSDDTRVNEAPPPVSRLPGLSISLYSLADDNYPCSRLAYGVDFLMVAVCFAHLITQVQCYISANFKFKAPGRYSKLRNEYRFH